MTRQVTEAERDAALKTLARWDAEELTRNILKRQRNLERLRSVIDSLFDHENLMPWALAKWEEDKAQGIGRKLSREKAAHYYLTNLARHLAEVCEAFQIAPEDVEYIMKRKG